MSGLPRRGEAAGSRAVGQPAPRRRRRLGEPQGRSGRLPLVALGPPREVTGQRRWGAARGFCFLCVALGSLAPPCSAAVSFLPAESDLALQPLGCFFFFQFPALSRALSRCALPVLCRSLSRSPARAALACVVMEPPLRSSLWPVFCFPSPQSSPSLPPFRCFCGRASFLLHLRRYLVSHEKLSLASSYLVKSRHLACSLW